MADDLLADALAYLRKHPHSSARTIASQIDPQNTYVTPRGHRRCRECKRSRERAS